MWNLRLELGHRLHPTPMRTTEFAPAQVPSDPVLRPSEPMNVPYGPPQWARQSYTKGFAGADFPLQPDGTLRCPAGQPLYAQERRSERDGSLRVLYAARIGHCRSCPLRERCQEKGPATIKPRRVSAVFWPVVGPPPEPAVLPVLPPAARPILWGDWSRCQTRREWICLLRSQTVTMTLYSSASLADAAEGRATDTQCLFSADAEGKDSPLRHPNRICNVAGPGRLWLVEKIRELFER